MKIVLRFVSSIKLNHVSFVDGRYLLVENPLSGTEQATANTDWTVYVRQLRRKDAAETASRQVAHNTFTTYLFVCPGLTRTLLCVIFFLRATLKEEPLPVTFLILWQGEKKVLESHDLFS